MHRETYLENISDALSVLSTKIQLGSSRGLINKNLRAEDFIRDFLNMLLGCKLINLNESRTNTEAIDLSCIDNDSNDNNFAVQVTASTNFDKIRQNCRQIYIY